VLTHEAAVTGHIGGENGRQTALYPLPAHDAFSLNATLSGFRVVACSNRPVSLLPRGSAINRGGAVRLCALRPRPEALRFRAYRLHTLNHRKHGEHDPPGGRLDWLEP
jgi:hypothetical protein